MPRAQGYQWNSELPEDCEDDLPDLHHCVAQDDDDELLAAEAEQYVQARKVTVDSLHLPPLSGLSVPLLCAIRERAFETGIYDDYEDLDTASAVKMACFRCLNQIRAEGESRRGTPYSSSREIVLLSLISPQVVLSAVCEWARRQTILGRMTTACEIVLSLGNLSAYRRSAEEPGALVAWFREAYNTCFESDSEGELSRLCQLLSHLLSSQNDLGLAPISPMSCLQSIVHPMLAAERTVVAHHVIIAVMQSVKNQVVFQESELGSVLPTLELLVTNCSLENRRGGKMHVVEAAVGSIDELMPSLAPPLVQRVLSKLREIAPWPLLWRMQRQARGREDGIAKYERQIVHMLREQGTGRHGSLLRQCETLIVVVASSDNEWKSHKDLVQACKQFACTGPIAKAGSFRETWLVAMARQMLLLTGEELSCLFSKEPSEILPAALFSQQCWMEPDRGCRDCQKWCSVVHFAQIGVRALMLLLRSDDLCRNISSDDLAVLRVTRTLCSLFVSFTSPRRKDRVPHFVYLSCLVEVYLIVARCCHNDCVHVRKNSEISDVLTATVLELARNFRAKADEPEHHQTLLTEVGKMTTTVRKMENNNALCRNISKAMLPILLGNGTRRMGTV